MPSINIHSFHLQESLIAMQLVTATQKIIYKFFVTRQQFSNQNINSQKFTITHCINYGIKKLKKLIVRVRKNSKIHLQYKPTPYRVIVQPKVFGVNIAILPIYAKSLMIQVIRPFLIYAVVIHLYFVVV